MCANVVYSGLAVVILVGCSSSEATECLCAFGEVCRAGRCVSSGTDSGAIDQDAGFTAPADSSMVHSGDDAAANNANDAALGSADSGLADSGGPQPDSGTEPTCEGGTCEQLFFVYSAGDHGWSSGPFSDIARGAGAPPARGIMSGFHVCDFGLGCLTTESGAYCTPDLGETWYAQAWDVIAAGLPQFEPPTFASATPERSAVGRLLILYSGSKWWHLRLLGPPTLDTVPVELVASFASPGRSTTDVEWADVPNAPPRTAEIVADWLDVEGDGSGVQNLLASDGTAYRFFLSADGSVAQWQAPRRDPRFQLPGAPRAAKIAAASSDCSGGLFVIAEP